MDIQLIAYTFVGWLGTILSGAILIRVLLSWVNLNGGSGPVFRLLDDITEPILAPIRRVMPTFGMFDLSPIVAFILINFITRLLQSTIAS